MPKRREQNVYYYLGVLGNIGFQIAVPLVVFVLLGRWLDQRWDSSPWFLLGGILLSLITTTVLMTRKIQSILRDLDSSDHSSPPSS